MDELSQQTPPEPGTIATEPPRPGLVRRIFLGPNGLRALWRLLIYLILAFALTFLFGFFVRFLMAGHRRVSGISPLNVIIFDGLMFLAFVVASLIMGHFERRTLADYGLPARGMFGRRFWEGAVWGFVALSVLLLAIAGVGDFSFGKVALSGSSLAWWAITWGVAFLFVGFAEEYMLRGYSMFTLTTGIGFWPAAIVLSLAFAGLHIGNSGENWLGIANVAAIGLFFCLTLRRTGSLWFAIGFHAAWDWGETFFYGVPDSGMVAPGHLLSPTLHGSHWITGGTAGPEGSILALAVIAVISAATMQRFRQAQYPKPAATLTAAQEQPPVPLPTTPEVPS